MSQVMKEREIAKSKKQQKKWIKRNIEILNLYCNNTQGTCDIILVFLLKRRLNNTTPIHHYKN